MDRRFFLKILGLAGPGILAADPGKEGDTSYRPTPPPSSTESQQKTGSDFAKPQGETRREYKEYPDGTATWVNGKGQLVVREKNGSLYIEEKPGDYAGKVFRTRAEEARAQAEEAGKRAEEAGKRAEAAKKKAEEAGKRAEAAGKRAEAAGKAAELAEAELQKRFERWGEAYLRATPEQRIEFMQHLKQKAPKSYVRFSKYVANLLGLK